MLERIKAAVDAVERKRATRRLLMEHLEYFVPIWSVSADGRLVANIVANTWSNSVDSADTGIIWDRWDNGAPYDTSTKYDYTDTYTHTIVEAQVW